MVIKKVIDNLDYDFMENLIVKAILNILTS